MAQKRMGKKGRTDSERKRVRVRISEEYENNSDKEKVKNVVINKEQVNGHHVAPFNSKTNFTFASLTHTHTHMHVND